MLDILLNKYLKDSPLCYCYSLNITDSLVLVSRVMTSISPYDKILCYYNHNIHNDNLLLFLKSKFIFSAYLLT